MNVSKRRNKPTGNFAFILIIFILIFWCFVSPGQVQVPATRIMFYNVENLFDIRDDQEKSDEEYLPGGIRGWTYRRMNEKILKISKVILYAGNPEPPALIGLCEVENRFLLEKLIKDTPLNSFGYRIIHKESPDGRGIDVALLYMEKEVSPVQYQYLQVRDEKNKGWTTREILYFSAKVGNGDTIHFFFNHWPSRSGGLLETADKRSLAAKILRNKILDLQAKFKNPLIIVMGDFNDQPSDESLYKILGAGKPGDIILDKSLYNLSFGWTGLSYGTHKFQSEWSVFDQVIVSGSVLNHSFNVFCTKEDAGILKPSFLIQNDKTYGGIKPFRTYSGYKYIGGFSDHFPVFLDIRL